MHFGFCSVTPNNVKCLKGSVIFNSLNWRPIFQVWFIIQNRAYAVLTNLKQPPQFTSCPCHMHRWAGLGVLLIKALILGSRIMYQLQWTVVVTIAEGEECSTQLSKQALHCLFALLSLPMAMNTAMTETRGTRRWSLLQAGEPWNITHSTHVAAYSADLSLMFQWLLQQIEYFFRKKALVAQSVWLFVTPWTVTCQTPLSVEFSRQKYWSGLPSPGDLPTQGSKPCLLCW